jgi:hypothetical protein
MNALRDYVDWKLAHADKTAEVEGYPLVLKKCKKNKRMKGLKVWGHNLIKDNRSTSRETATFTIVGSKLTLNGSNASNAGMTYNSKYSTTLKANVKYTFSIHYISGEFVSGVNGVVIGLFSSSNNWVVSPTRYVSNYQNTYTMTVTVKKDTSVSFGITGWGEFNNLVFGIQLVEGDSVGEYKGYVGEYIADETDFNFGKYKIPILQRGKNLLDMMRGYDWSSSSRLGVYDNGHLWKGNISSSTDQYVASAGWVSYNVNYTQKFPIMKGKSITISVDVTPIEKHDETRKTATKFLCLVYKGTTEVKTLTSSEIPLEIGVKSHLSYTFMPSNYEGDALKVIVYLCSHTMKIENLQVEYGSTDTPYEPYVEPTTHNVFVDEPLSANDVLDVKEHMELPKLTAKTTVFTTDTTTPPSKMYGKYIKR